jgi:hypothetical protein
MPRYDENTMKKLNDRLRHIPEDGQVRPKHMLLTVTSEFNMTVDNDGALETFTKVAIIRLEINI